MQRQSVHSMSQSNTQHGLHRNTSMEQILFTPERPKTLPSHSKVMKHYSNQIRILGIYSMMALMACLFYFLGLLQKNTFYANYLATLPVYYSLESRAPNLSYTYSFKVQSLLSSSDTIDSLKSFYAKKTTEIQQKLEESIYSPVFSSSFLLPFQ